MVARDFSHRTRSVLSTFEREQFTELDNWRASKLLANDTFIDPVSTALTTVNDGTDVVTGNNRVIFLVFPPTEAITRGNFNFSINNDVYTILTPGFYHVTYHARLLSIDDIEFRGSTRCGLVNAFVPRTPLFKFFSHCYLRGNVTADTGYAHADGIIEVPRQGLSFIVAFETITEVNVEIIAEQTSLIVKQIAASS